jgi:hypothetical protein
MIKAASSYRLSSVVQKNPRLSVGSEDRLSRRAKIFGQNCQDGWIHLDLFWRSIIEAGLLEWFNSSKLPTGIDKN